MATLKQWMEAVNYRITEGSEYCWECYGHKAYTLDSWNGDQDGHSFSIVFDLDTQTVYEMQAHDYANTRAYRWINPEYVDAHRGESIGRGVNINEAWDDLEYTTLEVEDDYFEKVEGIREGKDYDTRVKVPLTLGDDEMFELMKMAHEQDITLNQLVEQLLTRVIAEHSKETELG